MERTLLVILLACVLGSPAYAGRASVEFLAHNLNLNDAQRGKVEIIMAAQYQTHKSLRKAGQATCDNKRKMWLDTRQKMYDVLTEEQLATFDKLQRKRQRGCSLRTEKVAATETSRSL